MDDVFEGDEEAEEDIYNQIFDEVGIEFNQKAAKVPGNCTESVRGGCK